MDFSKNSFRASHMTLPEQRKTQGRDSLNEETSCCVIDAAKRMMHRMKAKLTLDALILDSIGSKSAGMYSSNHRTSIPMHICPQRHLYDFNNFWH